MTLSKEDLTVFYTLYPSLMLYANQKFKVLRGVKSIDAMISLPAQQKLKIRNTLFRNEQIIDEFVQQNPFGFKEEHLQIVSSWKHRVEGDFIILRQMKRYAIFLTTDRKPMAYGVLALTAPFEQVIPMPLPVYVQAMLLPFKGRIVYDGLLQSHQILFGPGMRRSFEDTFKTAKARYGIITSLPFTPIMAEDADEKLLKAYLSTERSREEHWQEIEKLLDRNPSLLPVYHQEMGKIHARALRRQLKEMGLRPGWFAVLEGIILTGSSSKEEVERIVAELVPPEKQPFVYIFQWKGTE